MKSYIVLCALALAVTAKGSGYGLLGNLGFGNGYYGGYNGYNNYGGYGGYGGYNGYRPSGIGGYYRPGYRPGYYGGGGYNSFGGYPGQGSAIGGGYPGYPGFGGEFGYPGYPGYSGYNPGFGGGYQPGYGGYNTNSIGGYGTSGRNFGPSYDGDATSLDTVTSSLHNDKRENKGETLQ